MESTAPSIQRLRAGIEPVIATVRLPAAARAVEEQVGGGLTKPTFRGVLLTGLPGFLREGFLPLGAFYVGWRLSGLGAGIAASAVASFVVYALERRAGRDGLLVKLSLAFVAMQAVNWPVSLPGGLLLAPPVVGDRGG